MSKKNGRLNPPIQANLSQITEIGSMLLPKGKSEWLLFGGFALFYLSYSIVIALYTALTNNEKFWADIFFEFDTSLFLHRGTTTPATHPMLHYFMAPLLLLGNLLELLFNSCKAKTLLFTVLCCSLIAASIVYVYRYLRTIIGLSGFALYLPTLFYAFTSTSLILCFTPESFPVSAFLLTFTVYYYAYVIKNDIPVQLASNVSLALLLGGTTITNLAKGIIPLFFTEKRPRSFIRKFLVITGIFAVFLLLNNLIFAYDTSVFFKHYRTFSVVIPKGDFYSYVCGFFGTPVFFSQIIHCEVRVYAIIENAVRMTLYAHWQQYAFIGVLYLLVIWSAIVNRKNKLVQMLLLLFGVDIFIHVIFRFGLYESFIYGGHWVYCLPLLLGWLFGYASAHKRLKISLIVVTSILLAGLVVNNIFRLADIIHIALKYWAA